MMILHFTKMQALGNDFMVIDGLTQPFKPKRRQIRQWACRHTGVGFDQLLMVEPPLSPEADFFFRIFNADGSSAEQCGNGARCFGRFVYENRLATKPRLLVETVGGTIHIEHKEKDLFSVEMGQPAFHPNDVPFLAGKESNRYAVEAGSEQLELSVVSVGNPHAVILVDDVKNAPVHTWGPLVAQHTRFPRGVNVGFMQVVNRKKIALRVYERGVGETRACGTGAAAAVSIGHALELLDAAVEVELPGGTLEVTWQGSGHPIWLTGPAKTVYQGRMRV